MEDKEQVEKTTRRGSRTGTRRRYTYDEKMRAFKLHLEEGFTEKLVGEETARELVQPVTPDRIIGTLHNSRKSKPIGF